MPHGRVLPPGEFNVMIPVPCATLQGAVTWRNQCYDHVTLQGIRIPSAILKIVIRHIFFVFLQFGLRRAAAFVSSPIHLFRYASARLWNQFPDSFRQPHPDQSHSRFLLSLSSSFHYHHFCRLIGLLYFLLHAQNPPFSQVPSVVDYWYQTYRIQTVWYRIVLCAASVRGATIGQSQGYDVSRCCSNRSLQPVRRGTSALLFIAVA